jgi:hypothetical protein
VTGPLETFANAGGVHVARALLAELSENIARLVIERRGAVPAATDQTANAAAPPANPTAVPAAPAAAAELSASGLLWRIVKAWFRGLFTKKD